MSRAPTYDWRCRHCDSVNVAHTTVCTTCGFDTEYHPSPTLWAAMASDGVPRWKRLLCYLFLELGASMLIVGMFAFVWIYFLIDATGMIWSAAIALLGVLQLWVTHKLYPRVL